MEHRLHGHQQVVTCLALSPDGKNLASGDDMGSLKLWDVAAREELIALPEHAGRVSAAAFSPDGRTLAIAADIPDGSGEIHLREAPR